MVPTIAIGDVKFLFAFEYKNYWNNILNDVQKEIKNYFDKKTPKIVFVFIPFHITNNT